MNIGIVPSDTEIENNGGYFDADKNGFLIITILTQEQTFVDGTEAENTENFDENFRDYEIQRLRDTVTIKNKDNSENKTLKNGQYIQFADQTVAFSQVDVVKTYTGNCKDFKFFKRIDGTIEIKTEDGFENITGVPETKV